MFKTMKYLYISILCILALSCQQIELIELPQTDERQIINIQGAISQEYITRANDEGFVDGDRMGVFVVDYEGGLPGKLKTQDNRANNLCYTYNEETGTWKSAGTIFWRDKNTPVDVFGYYPFENVVSSIEEYEFEIKVNQNMKGEGEMSSYEASDFLWAKTTGAKYGTSITLTYGHLMAGVQVFLQKGTGFTDVEWDKLHKLVSVDNTIRTATINLEKGIIATSGAYDMNIILSDEGTSYRGVVVPQTVEVGKSVIGVTIDGISYSLKKDIPMNYMSGQLHKFTIKVDKYTPSGEYELSIIDQQVVPWENDKSSHNFEGKAYVVVHVEKEGTLNECILNLGTDISSIKNLKITGRLTGEDFAFIRREMFELESLNLSEAKILNAQTHSYSGINLDNVLPAFAFDSMRYLSSLILPNTLEGLGSYSLGIRLTSTLILPESLTTIYSHAFEGFVGNVEFPNNIQVLETDALSSLEMTGLFKFTDSIRYIGDRAFCQCHNLDVEFNLPSNLSYWGKNSFFDCQWKLTGDIVIPQNITEIPAMVFHSVTFISGTRLHLHDNVKIIGEYAFGSLVINNPVIFPESVIRIDNGAFANTKLRSGAILPKNLTYIGSFAFENSTLSGNLTIPNGVLAINENCFAYTNIESLTIGNNVESIAKGAFQRNSRLKSVFIGDNVEYIGDEAFARCSALTVFRCTAKTPPALGQSVFKDLDFNHVVLEVPRELVELYRSANGWSEFKYIAEYSELAVGLSEITAINKGCTSSTILRSEGPWEVVSCPEWCTVSPMSADTKAEISITVCDLPMGSGDRDGDIVFKLKNKDYTTYTKINQYDYEQPEDKEIVLQEASSGGTEIPIFIIGEGFTAKELIDGSYMDLLNSQIEYFFDIEPYRTYRNYFTISTALVRSAEKGIGNMVLQKENRFNTIDNNGVFVCDYDKLKEYVKSVSSHIDENNIHMSLIIVMVNSETFGGNVRIENDGTTICFCPLSNDSYPYDQRGIIQHYVGGCGFGKLASESVSHFDFISLCGCPGCNMTDEYYWAKKYGWYDNISLSAKMSDVPWSHLIFHEKYSSFVDIYEGGLGHARGVYRSEINSCMNTYIPYYNTISRESIVRRIMNYAGKEYNFDEFVANDKIEIE